MNSQMWVSPLILISCGLSSTLLSPAMDGSLPDAINGGFCLSGTTLDDLEDDLYTAMVSPDHVKIIADELEQLEFDDVVATLSGRLERTVGKREQKTLEEKFKVIKAAYQTAAKKGCAMLISGC